MEVNFLDIVGIKTSSCRKCFALIYTIPCEIEEDLAAFMTSFGELKYDLDIINLFQIESSDSYSIIGKLKNNYLKFSVPKEIYKNLGLPGSRKLEFENNLVKWIENKLDITIIQ